MLFVVTKVQQIAIVQRLDSTFQQMKHYPLDKYYEILLGCSVDSDLSHGQSYPSFKQLVPEQYSTEFSYVAHVFPLLMKLPHVVSLGHLTVLQYWFKSMNYG